MKEQDRGQTARTAVPGGQRAGCDQEMDLPTALVSPNWGEGVADPYVNPRDVILASAPLNEGMGPGKKSCSSQLYPLGKITEIDCPSR